MTDTFIRNTDSGEEKLNLSDALRPIRGRRLMALLRETRQVLHNEHTPGTLLEMSRGRKYEVAADGSYRRQ